MKPKSKLTAYLLLIFLGAVGAHRFYLGKIGSGIFYVFTLGGFGIGILIDLFTLSGQVDRYNAQYAPQTSVNQQQNVTVNVVAPTSAAPAATAVKEKVSADREILQLTESQSVLTLKDVMTKTSLGMDEAEEALKKLTDKGLAKELVDESGKITYDFS